MSTLAQPAQQSDGLSRRARTWGPALVVFGLGIVAWQWLLPALGIERYLLPPMSDVLQAFWDERGELGRAGWITFKEALGGFVLGCSLAFVIALALARWRPITNAWFGTLSPWSKVVIAAVLCFFPVLVNTLRGLTSVRPEALELMRSYAAPQRVVFRRVRIPNSLPFVFSALKIASVLAMIGAVVGDYFGGSTEALGVKIISAVSLAQYETAWAAILMASLLGIAFYATVALAERLALHWHPSTRAGNE
jgi:NitT/TauT family transport system permease protein